MNNQIKSVGQGGGWSSIEGLDEGGDQRAIGEARGAAAIGWGNNGGVKVEATGRLAETSKWTCCGRTGRHLAATLLLIYSSTHLPTHRRETRHGA